MNHFPAPDDGNYTTIGVMERVPSNVSYLASKEDQPGDVTELHLLWHASSMHLRAQGDLSSSYYEDYLMTTTFSEKMQCLQKSQLEKLILLNGNIQSLVEIGCGDGSFLNHARQRISHCLGIEPSRKFAEEAIRQGHEVINAYVGSKTPLTDRKFDAFVSRQVFEHLESPLDVLTAVKQMLTPNAIGLIEVPNGYKALREQRFYDIFPDHINYYSVNSLVALASSAGFNVIACAESFDGDYLELWVRNDLDANALFAKMQEGRRAICDSLCDTLQRLQTQGKRVAVWGAGAKALTILAACPPGTLTGIAAVFDSDPHKNGRFIPGTCIQILLPARAQEVNPDVVFILALSYRYEIAHLIGRLIPSCTQILTIDNDGRVADM